MFAHFPQIGRFTVPIGKNLAYEDEKTIDIRLSYDPLEAGWHRAAIRRSVAPLLRDEAEDFRFRQGSFETYRAALLGRELLGFKVKNVLRRDCRSSVGASTQVVMAWQNSENVS